MELVKIKAAHEDARGSITDLVANGKFDSATIVNFKKGAIRGNHYHKATTQWNYVLSGEIQLVTQFEGKEKVEVVLKKGDMARISENEIHALKALSDSELLVVTMGVRAGQHYEDDTYRSEATSLIIS